LESLLITAQKAALLPHHGGMRYLDRTNVARELPKSFRFSARWQGDFQNQAAGPLRAPAQQPHPPAMETRPETQHASP